MNEINNKELNERVANLADKIGTAMEDEIIMVYLPALLNVVAFTLFSFSKKASLKTECSIKAFYEDLLIKTKELE